MASLTHRPILHRYSFIAARRAKSHSCLASTAGHTPDRLFQVIYNLNLRDPVGFFLASKFEMRNKDVIYASNSLSVESSKFMNYLRLIVGTAQDPVAAATSVYILRNTIASATSAIAVTTGSTVGVPIVSP